MALFAVSSPRGCHPRRHELLRPEEPVASDPQNADSIVKAVLETPKAERPAVLDRVCGGDPELRRSVELLLDAHDRQADDPSPRVFTQTVDPVPEQVRGPGTADYPSPAENLLPHPMPAADRRSPSEAGSIADRYTLVEKLGEGGMGEVWVAQQRQPVKRKVALKLIKTGMDTRAVLQRFEQERQALALMDHPNIARVIDAGKTADGRPFFVMELVNGLPLNRYCDAAKMGVRERLELFTSICNAVQHAHQKGIIHRDLKPFNILVTLLDGKPVPKVIDFGVAKAISGRLTDESLSTQFGAVVGTLEYMAPEQAGLSGGDIDTRADIYSLGVILYELLTGLRPIDAKRLKNAAFTEMVRLIKEEEPAKPSTRVLGDASAPSVAALRQLEPRKLSALLRGELDWVVMKCLEKARDRRYETANGLARDIQRYLANEVVEARPPSARYRLGKFLRRNKGPVVAASLLLLALVTGIVGTTYGLIRAETAHAEAVERAEGERLAKVEAIAARDKADEAHKAEAAQRALAEQNAKLASAQATLALNTVQDLISQVQNHLDAPGLLEAKTALLDIALKRVDGVANV